MTPLKKRRIFALFFDILGSKTKNPPHLVVFREFAFVRPLMRFHWLNLFFSESDREDRDVGRSDSGDSTGLSDGDRSDGIEVISRFGFKTIDRIVIEVLWNTLLFHALEAFDLNLLSVEMTRVFEIGFQKRPERVGDLLENGRR